MLKHKLIKFSLLIIAFLLCLSLVESKPLYIATSSPVEQILKEITGISAEIITLVGPGASPHTYTPKPSQVVKAQKADALFYISEYLDGWASNLSTKKKYKLIDLLPKSYRLNFESDEHHDHDGHKHNTKNVVDPHFWTDPLTVKAIVSIILKKLISVNPENEDIYRNNAEAFEKKLDALNLEIKTKMKRFEGEPVFLFHPSFRYFLKRYGLKYMGSIETSPGKEPSADYTMKLIKKIKSAKAKALFTEPQLPSGPVMTIAEGANLKYYTLDPLGGIENLRTYFELIRYNTDIFVEALKK
ncbi:MAG: metal ABC transporter substrate-binding protein [bacterium]